jgi:hypothetical protein
VRKPSIGGARRLDHGTRAEQALEAGVRDEVAPTLADEAGADEARRAVGLEPEQNLFDEIVYQRWWRRRHARPGWVTCTDYGTDLIYVNLSSTPSVLIYLSLLVFVPQV